MRSGRPFSMRARLLWLLLAAILATAVVQAAVAYSTANVQANGIFDYHMQQMAMSLRSGLAASAPAPQEDEPGRDPRSAFVVQVWTSEGLLAYQSAHATQLPERSELGFSEANANGIAYRVFSLRSRSQVIQVAQDLGARKTMAQTLALRAVAPTMVMAPLLMLIVWGVVSMSLRPVARVRQEVAERQPDDLAQVSEDGLPDEVRPLIQELNLLFGRVRQSFDAQSRFVADAAHELRTPLAALGLQVLSLERAGDEGTRQVAATRLRAGIDRATRLVEQLLALARQEARSAERAQRVEVRLLDVARQAIVDAAPRASARHVDLGLRRADEAIVPGHADALRTLVGNLLDNAIKYTPEGGTIDVEVLRDGHGEGVGVELVVEDSGPGIAEEERERVMDRFYRLAGEETVGSGLGLAIAKSIADMHDATLALAGSSQLGGLRASVRFA
ncbi:MAG TPA: ATP-binding protein, partial [Burkholderiaceae bacterium]|nr:ATP-binding protein [Burkholderiaceae bacterium]